MIVVFGVNILKVYQVVEQVGLVMVGMFCGLYYIWDEVVGILDCVQVILLVEVYQFKGFEIIEVVENEALFIEYYGGYEGLGVVYMVIEGYCKQYGLEAGVLVIEEYVMDLGLELDILKWLIRVYYFLLLKG